ncbi:response regulator [Pseudomonas sp. ML96]|uniref:response regulator n=1 Tax=Pseudomonas sp. ML96 TaxID=1523503 RepID=UPI0012E04364|nr:response regulator [Pseudomonas sp. ML96]
MAERIRNYDWSSSSLGPIETWPSVLRTAVALCLESRFPQAVMWGSDLITLHNDAFSLILGNKPPALGKPFKEVWSEVWEDIRPIAENALAGQATFIEDFPLLIERGNSPEWAYFTFCYSPIRDADGQVIGILDTVAETTSTVLTNQRLEFLDELARSVVNVTNPDAIMATITRMLGEHMKLSSCAYADMDPDQDGFTIRGDWAAQGVPHLLGHYHLADFGQLAVERLSAGQAFVIDNNLKQLPDHESAAFQALGITATICIPLVKEGRLTALMAVHDKVPRAWSAYEQSLIRDVSQRCWAHIERVRAEVKLRELNESLEERVALMVAQREGEVAEHHETRKMETIGQLTGGIAHDFNNLLTPIMITLDLIRRRLEDDRSIGLVDAALQAADKARVLVGRLLTFARRQTLQPSAVMLEALVADMRDLISRSLGPTIEVVVNVPSHLPAVLVDPHQLELAVLNLAVNARDAMADGGRLEINAVMDRVAAGAVRGMAAGNYVCLRVLDNGCGMNAETLQRCTEPFFSTKGVGKGTGLGLSMVQGLAAQSGGGLGISSAEGEGTRVNIWLPITEDPAANKDAELDEAPLAPRAALVLLVDDEELVRRTTALQLQDLGYQVQESASAAAALQMIEAGLRPDVLVTDHIMPDKSGTQLARELRQRLPNLPVLVLTGYSNLSPEQMHGFDVLAKPFRRSEIAERLSSLVCSLG